MSPRSHLDESALSGVFILWMSAHAGKVRIFARRKRIGLRKHYLIPSRTLGVVKCEIGGLSQFTQQRGMGARRSGASDTYGERRTADCRWVAGQTFDVSADCFRDPHGLHGISIGKNDYELLSAVSGSAVTPTLSVPSNAVCKAP
jgi:hypothetical protein